MAGGRGAGALETLAGKGSSGLETEPRVQRTHRNPEVRGEGLGPKRRQRECLLMPPSWVECLLTSVPRGLCPVTSPHHLCILHLPQAPECSMLDRRGLL